MPTQAQPTFESLQALILEQQAKIAELSAMAKKPKAPTLAPTTKIIDLPMGYHRARVLRNMGWMNIPLTVDTTVDDYRKAVEVYVLAHPKKDKAVKA